MSEYPEILIDLGEILADQLTSGGCQPEQAADLAFRAIEHIRRQWGGQPIYIPKGQAYELSQRDQRIYEDWRLKGMSHELAHDHGVSMTRIYQIVRAQRLDRRQKATERPLFYEDHHG